MKHGGHYGILKTCKKGPKINCWESLSIQTYQHQGLFIKQHVNDFNPIYAQGSRKMMSHNHTFTLCSVPCKPSSKKLHSQGKPHFHYYSIIHVLNHCDSSTGLGPQGT